MKSAFEIIRFLVLAGGAALFVHLSIADENSRIFAFVFLMGFLAVLYPRIGTPLQSQAVDLMYYGAGILAAAVVFLGQDIARERLLLQRQDEQLERRQNEVLLEQTIFDIVAANHEEVAASINADVERKLASLRWHQEEGLCKPEFLMELRNRVESLRGSPSLRDEAQSAENQLLGMNLSCLRDLERLRKAAPDRDPTTRSLEATKRLVDLLELDEPVKIGETALPMAKALELLEHLREDGWRQAMVRQERETTRKRDALRSDLEELDGKRRTVFRWSREFVEFYWPYILISFLTMKIARHDYLSGRRARKVSEVLCHAVKFIALAAASTAKRLTRLVLSRTSDR